MLCFRHSNSSVICQCYFMLSWVWINFIPGNNYWRLQIFYFFSLPSNHDIWIKSLCPGSTCTVPESKHISCSTLGSCDSYGGPIAGEERGDVCFGLPQFLEPQKKIFLFSGSVNTTRDPGWTLTQSVYFVGAGLSNSTRDGWEIKPHTFSHYSHEECRPFSDGQGVRIPRSLVGPTLTVISGLGLGMRQAGRRGGRGCTRSHASAAKEADQFEVVQLSLTWRCHSSPATSNWRKGVRPWITKHTETGPLQLDLAAMSPLHLPLAFS